MSGPKRPPKPTPKPASARPPTPSSPRTPTLQVSRATARFISEGHPWVRPDRFTRGLEALKTGQAVTLVDDAGNRLASALAEPKGEVCARVFHRKPDLAFKADEALDRAWDRRKALHADPATDCYRVVHGEGDFLPGLRIERYGEVFVVVVFAECIASHVDLVCKQLGKRAKEIVATPIIVRRDHKDDLRREGVQSRRLDGQPLDPEAVVVGRELGVRYPLRPFAGLATGVYVDQRATRRWLEPHVKGARVLNLFAYTGAFSLHALANGAVHASDVDLAGPALKRAEEAAALNGFANHVAIKSDCRGFLAATTEQWDIVIVDPPTAAQGADGWVLRRDLPEVLALSLQRLAPGGLLVAACNTLGKPYPLADAVRDAAAATKTRLETLPAPPLGEDLPQIQGFPEGRPHRILAARSIR